MDTKQIIKGLKAEVKRLNRVITLLSGETAQKAGTRSVGKKRKMSRAEKNRRSVAAKKRWAKRKKAETGD